MKRRVLVVAAAALVLWLTDPGRAHRLSGQRWASGSSIVMHLQQGSSSGALIDGSRAWNVVTEGALGAWNAVLSSVSFRVVPDSTAGVALRNSANNVIWGDDVYGEPFGDAVAVTKYLYRTGDNTMVEADVVFDRGLSWNSYRGNLRSASGGGTLYDLRRVALHEFGHVLGLGHPDEHGQSVTAIMNSRVSNVDSLQTDDTSGARAIYGTASTPPTSSSNRAPTVTASCSPCTVEVAQTTSLRAAASDPDGDALTYQWSAPQGTFATPTAGTTGWSAPLQPAGVTVTVTVQDSRGARASATVALEAIFRDRLPSGARLLPGQSLVSTNGRYRLLYQADGNLVLYDETERSAPWASNTAGTGAGFASMQSDGNFVVYDRQGRDRFATGTASDANAYLVVQGDGNVVVYRTNGQPAWDRFSANQPTGSAP